MQVVISSFCVVCLANQCCESYSYFQADTVFSFISSSCVVKVSSKVMGNAAPIGTLPVN